MKTKLLIILLVLFCNNVKAQLTAKFNSNITSGCAPLTVSFQDSSIGNIATWSWNFGDGGTSSLKNPTHVYTSPGSYNVKLVIIDSLASSDSITKTGYITVFASPTVSVSSTNSSCNGFCNGAATLTVTGGTPPYTFGWTTGSTSISDFNLCPGNYIATVTDANSCGTTTSITIIEPPLLTATVTSTNNTCNGQCNGSAVLTPGGGTMPYTYKWSNGAIIPELLGILCAGVYTVTIKDANSCVTTANVTITEPPLLTAVVTSTNVTCFGLCTGSTDLTSAGGTGAHTYTWSNGINTQDQIGTLCAGAYTVTVRDANKCMKTATAIITQPSALTLITGKTDATCGNADGSAVVTVTGGTPAYTYIWSNGSTTQSINSLGVGSYTVTVRDANGCQNQAGVTINSGGPITGISMVSNVSCNGASDGSATVTASGGTLPYTYMWSNLATTTTVSGLTSGSYAVTISDANNCKSLTSLTISEPLVLTATITSTNLTCFGLCNASIDLTLAGGTVAYTYKWSNGVTTQDQIGICIGAYTVTVTDANSCTASSSVIISEPLALTTSVVSTNVSCNADCNGAIDLTPGGGSVPYIYIWSNGATTEDISALCAGAYTATVRDVNNCMTAATVIITQPSALTLITSKTDATCGANGSATVTATGGTPAYTYLWSTGSTTQTINSVVSGVYTVTITDANGCKKNTSIIILDLGIASVSTTKVFCNGQNDGSATVTATSGIAPFTYNWSNGATTTTIQNLIAGTYTVTVTDSLGCTGVYSTTVTEPTALSTSISQLSNVSCFGGSDGVLCASALGGTFQYTYKWSVGSTNSCITGVSAGTYTITVIDDIGCIAFSNITVNQPPQLIVSITGQTADNCNCNGTATASASGGALPYIYKWSNGQTNQLLQNVCSGVFTVTATDMNGCIDTVIVNINSTPSLNVILSSINTSCGVCNGTGNAVVSGGTLPYTYSWNTVPIQTTAAATGLCAGTYTVTIADSTGCAFDTSLVVGNSGGLSFTISSTNVNCNGGNNGVASAILSGGVPPYSYLWSNAQPDSTITGLIAGTIVCTVIDANGCSFITSATITEPTALNLTLNTVGISCGNIDGSITSMASGGSGGYTFSIDSGITFTSNNVFSNLDTGNYFIIVKDSNGCQITQQAVIGILTGSAVNLSGTAYNSSSCYYGSGAILLNISGGSSPYTYKWISPNLGVGKNKYNLAPGSYTVAAIDNNGCTDTAAFIVANTCQKGLITGYVFIDVNANCVKETGDSALTNWQVKAVGSNTYYGYVYSNGIYKIWVPAGNYTVSLVQKPYWNLVCPASPGTYPVTIATKDTVDNINFGNNYSLALCPNMLVSLIHIGYRPCFCAWYNIKYSNQGTVTAQNAYIELTLPKGITAVTACSVKTHLNKPPYNSTLWTSQVGNTYIYNLDSVSPGITKDFYVLVEQSCDIILNSTLCTEVHIYPDSSCFPVNPSWDKSSVSVEGSCVNDSLACFTIYNTGDVGDGDMDGSSQYRFYQNNILVSNGTFQLTGGDSIVICWTANGNTIRLEADQRPGHPGKSHPRANVELCGQPVYTLGQITLIQSDDADDFIDITCAEVTSSWDPNDKSVSPEGITDIYHFIDSTDILEYQIRFQNTGTDTAFDIYVYDTISPYLDITTFQAGASSHPYTYEVADTGIVRFTFELIMLPDSNVNEPESHGFIKYSIKQKEGNTKGTVIYNSAGIVFDFNKPVITNTVFNTIGKIDSVIGSAPVIYKNNISVKVYPNPFTSETTFEIIGTEKENNCSIEIFNILGEMFKTYRPVNSNKFVVDRNGFLNGIYFYKINSGSNLIGTGKLIIQ